MLQKMIAATFVMAVALTTAGGDALADPPPAFGPIAERTFAWKPGTTIEAPPDNCTQNADWLLIRGPGVANAKSIDISPHTSSPWVKNAPTTGTCLAPDCLQLFVKITPKQAVGKYTVTLKSPDGRTVSTTVDVLANAGRCDYPKK